MYYSTSDSGGNITPHMRHIPWHICGRHAEAFVTTGISLPLAHSVLLPAGIHTGQKIIIAIPFYLAHTNVCTIGCPRVHRNFGHPLFSGLGGWIFKAFGIRADFIWCINWIIYDLDT